MVERRQLPPQIKRIELTRRAGGRPVLRYQLTVEVGTVDGKRKQLRKRYATERDAREALDEIRGEVSKGTYVHPSVLTVEDACANWLMSRHGIKPKSKSGYDGVLAPVRAELGQLPVQKLTRRDVDELVTRLRDGQVARADGTKRRPWSARSCNYLLGTLSQVLDQLVHDGTLVRNVVAHVDRVAGKPKKFATYTPMQVERVLRAIREDRNRHAWHLALSGLRRGEIGGLRWTNIDLEAKTLTIGPTRISVDGKAVEQDDAKSEDSQRVLPIPDPLLIELRAAKKRQASEKLTLGAAYADLGYVVCNEGGQPYHPEHAVQDVGQGRRRGRCASDPAARRSAYLRHHNAPAGRPGGGDRGLARTRRRGIHNANVCALAARRADRRRAEFGTSCDKP